MRNDAKSRNALASALACLIGLLVEWATLILRAHPGGDQPAHISIWGHVQLWAGGIGVVALTILAGARKDSHRRLAATTAVVACVCWVIWAALLPA